MKATYSIPFAIAAATLFAFNAPLRSSGSEMDERIESTFMKTYVYKTYLIDDEIKAQSKDGVVTLRGTVSDEFHKSLAQQTAENLPGVTTVDNQLVCKSTRAAEESDIRIARTIKSMLLFRRNVSAIKTEVDVKDGIVTLKGEAASEAQKELTSEYAKDVEGVKDVKNVMTVATVPAKPEKTVGQKIDDASITAQVKMALISHRATSSSRTKVKTQDGVVTLSGSAHNAAEKDLVTKIVADIDGVKNIINNMTVDETLPK